MGMMGLSRTVWRQFTNATDRQTTYSRGTALWQHIPTHALPSGRRANSPSSYISSLTILAATAISTVKPTPVDMISPYF